jgi:hypothetical protein
MDLLSGGVFNENNKIYSTGFNCSHYPAISVARWSPYAIPPDNPFIDVSGAYGVPVQRGAAG